MAERAEKQRLAVEGRKRCGSCGEIKTTASFNVRRASPDGLCYKCRDCAAEALRLWREKNPDGFRRWHERNRDRRSEDFRRWRIENKDHRAAYMAEWSRSNREKVNANIARRTAAKRNAAVAWADQDAIERIYAEAARLTRETGIRHEVDHIFPLQGGTVCGLHVETNLQILTKEENIRKLNRMPHELGYA